MPRSPVRSLTSTVAGPWTLRSLPVMSDKAAKETVTLRSDIGAGGVPGLLVARPTGRSAR